MKCISLIPLLFLLASCSQESQTSAPPAKDWSSLTALHIQAGEVVDSLSAELEEIDAEKAIAEIKTAIEALAASGVPGEIPNAEEVKQQLKDLVALAEDFAEDPEALKAVQPLVTSMIETAGMKVPVACPSYGGHHGHDHDH